MSDEGEPSRAWGACVLVVLAGVVLAVVFAVSPTAGVLAVWVVGVAVLWRAARSMRRAANPAPPPVGATPASGATCEDAQKAARGVLDPNGIMRILPPVWEEVNKP